MSSWDGEFQRSFRRNPKPPITKERNKMKMVIVPNALRDAINSAIDRELEKCPEAVKDRQVFYELLLEYFDEHGFLPEFTITTPESLPPPANE